MQKLLLVSILAMTVLLPALAARERRPGLALRKALWWTLTGVAAYVLAVVLVYPHLPP